MGLQNFEAGKKIVQRGEKVTELYVLMTGFVSMKRGQLEMSLGPGNVIGLTDVFAGSYQADYITESACTVNACECSSVMDLTAIFFNQPVFIFGFAKSAVRLCDMVFTEYRSLAEKMESIRSTVGGFYSDYRSLCRTYNLGKHTGSEIEAPSSAGVIGYIKDWEYGYISSLNGLDNHDLETIFGGREEMVVGVIGSITDYEDRAVMAINDMKQYIQGCKSYLIDDSEYCLEKLLVNMQFEAASHEMDYKAIAQVVEKLHRFAESSGIFEPKTIAAIRKHYQAIDFEHAAQIVLLKEQEAEAERQRQLEEIRLEEERRRQEELAAKEDLTKADCMKDILEYAGFEEADGNVIYTRLKKYGKSADKDSVSDEMRALRRSSTEDFYNVYQRVFFRAIDDRNPSNVIKMFLNFGFMDVEFVGIDYAKVLYDLAESIELCQSENVFTIYSWLAAIYKGEKEPSKNELDLNFKSYILEERKSGHIKESEVDKYLNSDREKVKFEMKNFFVSANRITSGRVSTFHPLLTKDTLFTDPEKMLVTAAKLNDALNQIKQRDFGLFYREVLFSAPKYGVQNESLLQEVMPDIILMPNAGARGMMWQECVPPKKDTAGRFAFPIFTTEDIYKHMVSVCGSYRWEIGRREQGLRWNDVSNDSLTSQFYDYFSFYKKNKELTSDAKEKVRLLIKNSRNSMKEAFAKQYVIWIMFEAEGSPRLNKVERALFLQYCPLSKKYRNALREHPMFEKGISRFENLSVQKLHNLRQQINKYEQKGGPREEIMDITLEYYEL